MKFCLRGIAAKGFNSAGPFDDVEQAKKALFDRFLQEDDRVAASIQLPQLRQLETESVMQYFDRFDAMAEIAYGDEQPAMLMAFFLHGLLSPIMARDVQRQRPQTIMEALRLSREEEAFNQRAPQVGCQTGSDQNHGFLGNNSQESEAFTNNVLNGHVNQGPGWVGCERNRSGNAAKFQSCRRCYTCKSRNHFINDCPNRLPRQENNGMNQGNQWQGSNQDNLDTGNQGAAVQGLNAWNFAPC